MIAGATLGINAASAADMAVKAPYFKAPVSVVYDWTGFYIGANAGVGVGRDYTRLDVPAGGSFEASYLNPQGGLGGGQIGYNWQIPTRSWARWCSASRPTSRAPGCATTSIA